MALTDTQIRSARCPEGQAELILSDGQGLFAIALPSGGLVWRARFRAGGRQIKKILGEYPKLGLAQARRACLELREAADIQADPAAMERTRTLNDLYEDWYAHWSPNKAERTTMYAVNRYKAHVRPVLGAKVAASLRTMHFIDLTVAIEKSDRPEVARRVFAICRQIMARGTIRGWLPHNVLAGVSDGQVFKPAKEVNYARLGIDEMPAFYRALARYEGSTRMRIATKLLAYSFVRTGELMQAKWEQFDLDNALWCIPAHVMKTRKPHIVPLASQVVSMLGQLKEANTLKYGEAGASGAAHLFPGDRDSKKSICNNAVLAVIGALGYKRRMTGHGFRGVASTALNEAGFRVDVIETQLAHVQDKVRGAYNHAAYIPERQEMMQFWADAVDQMQRLGQVPEAIADGARLRAMSRPRVFERVTAARMSAA